MEIGMTMMILNNSAGQERWLGASVADCKNPTAELSTKQRIGAFFVEHSNEELQCFCSSAKTENDSFFAYPKCVFPLTDLLQTTVSTFLCDDCVEIYPLDDST